MPPHENRFAMSPPSYPSHFFVKAMHPIYMQRERERERERVDHNQQVLNMSSAVSDEATSSPAVTPTYNEQKFDRQLRLWGADGQSALEHARVSLFGATSAGCEMLKNMILPNLGSFSIVDHRIVTEQLIGSNFFIAPDDLVQRRPVAAAVVERLSELNPATRGEAITTQTPEEAVLALAAHYDALTESIILLRHGGGGGDAQPNGDHSSISPKHDEAIVDAPKDITSRQRSLSHSALRSNGHRPALHENGVFITTSLVPWSAVVVLSESLAAFSAAATAAQLAEYPLRLEGAPAGPVLMYLECNGLLGVVRVQGGERFVVRTHPDPQTVVKDLRVFNPFPALKLWFESHDPMDATESLYFKADDPDALARHSHLPWPCILYHALKLKQEEEKLKARDLESGTGVAAANAWTPKTGSDFAALRNIISKRMIRRFQPPEEAFEEALQECTMALDVAHRFKRSNIHSLLSDPRAIDPIGWCQSSFNRVLLQNIDNNEGGGGGGKGGKNRRTSSSHCLDPFWIVVHAVGIFIDRHGGSLPLSGSLPDFASLTEWYRELQTIYRNQATEDANEILELVHDLWGQVAAVSPDVLAVPPIDSLKRAVRDVCCHIWELSLVSYRSIQSEETLFDTMRRDEGRSLPRPYASTPDNDGFVEWYLVQRAVCQYRSRYHGRSPGCTASSHTTLGSVEDLAAVEADALKLVEILRSDVIGSFGDSDAVKRLLQDRWPSLLLKVREICRYGGAEMNCVASIVGAAAAQEAIKLIQRRRVPAHDVVLFDGHLQCFGVLVV